MDVLRLNAVTYYPDALIEGYSSMIWTERNLENGDFEMKTPKVAETRALLPIGSQISLRDTNEIMMVETHSIGRDNNGYSELTVTGRTFETFLENRVLAAAVYNTPWQVYKTYTPSEFVSLLLWNHAVNATGEDPTRAATTKSTYDAIPQVVVTDSTTRIDAAKVWWLESGIVYSTLRDILTLSELGVRSIRPPGTTGNVMTFDVTRTVSRGTVSKASTSNISQIRLDVYNGLDRSRNQGILEPVMFHYDSGHIDDPKYLFSIKEYNNFAIVLGSMQAVEVWPDVTPAPDTTVNGLARRPLYVDGETVGTMSTPDFVAAMTQKGRLELKKRNQTAVFDGAISPLSPYKYNQHYFLGDKVTLLAEYGYEATMVVSEYIRTEDQSGDRGYPGLSTIV
jgi:hypothetical protein